MHSKGTRSHWTWHRLAMLLIGVTALAVLGIDACPGSFSTYRIPMRDGALLWTDVYESTSRAPSPTIVIRTPYGRESNQGVGLSLSGSGYSVVSQDIRGTGESQGIFMLFTDDGWGANQDGFDTVEWSTAGEWSNGDACLWGGSALAIATLMASGSVPPSLVCAYSLAGAGDLFHHAAYQGGAMRQELIVNWLSDLGAYAALDATYDHPTDDAFWEPVALQKRYELVNIPIYHMGGWYDIFAQATLDAFAGLHNQGAEGAAGRQKLLMGPWTHGGTAGELVYPSNGALPGGEDVRWFEHWLKGANNGIEVEPPVKYYLMGDPTDDSAPGNVWKTADNWPVPFVATPYYFRGEELLTTVTPGLEEAALHFSFDPVSPVPTLGGPNLYLAAGSYDQTSVLFRPDVLYFETPPLENPVAVTGPVRAHLWVTSSAPDTDFTVKLMDVYPDGEAMLVLDGVIRMRFREGQAYEVLMTPGALYEAEVDLWSTALVFNAGHRIAVAVSSSNYPRFDLNPNTGGPLNTPQQPAVAEQTLHVDGAHPSHILLPVVELP